MATQLPPDFPSRAALEAAREATPAKLRKRIADGTLQKITGIGPSHEKEIIAAFEKFDSPAVQAEEMKASEDDKTTPADHAAKGAKREADSQQASAGEAGSTTSTIVNDGTVSDSAVAAAKREATKPGDVKNREMANHALDKPPGGDAAHNAALASSGNRLATSAAVVVDDPRGQYVSKRAVRIGADEGRVKVLPIGQTSPVKGMEIRDGKDVYALGDEFGRDSKPQDWLRVRSPNTGQALID